MTTPPSAFEILVITLTEATRTFGSKRQLLRYLRDYYYEINTAGDLLVNEMIDIFEAAATTPTADMFIIPHPDTDLVELCARHIAEEALASERIAHSAVAAGSKK